MISVAIVGCGKIAGGYDEDGALGRSPRTHAAAYRAHAGVRLAACVEPDATRRTAFCRTWNVERSFPDLDALAGSGMKLDVVSVCSPSACHAADLHSLLDMDVRGVICEKPLATDVAAARDLVARYRADRRPLAVAYMRRWDPNIAALAAQIRDGAFGGLQSAVGFYGKGLFNNGSHLVDLISLLFGPPSPVGARARFAGPSASDPTPDFELRTPGGAPIHLVATDSARFDLFELTLVFDKAVVELREGASLVVVRWIGPTPGYSGHFRPAAGDAWPPRQDEAFGRMVGEMLAVVRDGGPLACDGEAALQTLSICAALAAFLPRS